MLRAAHEPPACISGLLRNGVACELPRRDELRHEGSCAEDGRVSSMRS